VSVEDGVVMPWVLLLAAVSAEVAATLSLRASDGLTRPGPLAVVVAGYGLAFVLLSRVISAIGVGPVYATWSGLGTVGAAAGGWLIFSERLGPLTVAGIVMVAQVPVLLRRTVALMVVADAAS
jgi:small multidrug resistance pump